MRVLMIVIVLVPATLFAQELVATASPVIDTSAGVVQPISASSDHMTATAAPATMYPALSASVTSVPPASGANAFIAVVRPSKPPVHAFMDRTNLIGFGVHAAVRAADTTQTCMLLGKAGRREAWLPFQSCPAIAAYSMSMVPAQIATSYVLHKRGLHRMERWVPYLWAAPSAAGFTMSLRAW